MKLYKYCFALLALTTVTVSGCKNEDINEEHHYDNKLYVSSAPVCDDLLIKPSITEAFLGLQQETLRSIDLCQ